MHPFCLVHPRRIMKNPHLFKIVSKTKIYTHFEKLLFLRIPPQKVSFLGELPLGGKLVCIKLLKKRTVCLNIYLYSMCVCLYVC